MSDGCRFIAGDPSEARKGIDIWCGEDRKPAPNYCPDHHQRCYVKPKPRPGLAVSKETGHVLR